MPIPGVLGLTSALSAPPTDGTVRSEDVGLWAQGLGDPMRYKLLPWMLIGSLGSFLAGISVASPAFAETVCRCECRVEFVAYGGRVWRRRICQRRCWQEPRRFEQPPPIYRFTTPAPKYSAPVAPAPTPRFDAPSFALPRIPPEFAFALALVAAGIVISRLIAHISAIVLQRRTDAIEHSALSARVLKKRLERDAREADEMIRKFTQQSYRSSREV